MSRRGIVTTNRVLALVIAGLFVASFTPTRFLRWTVEPARVLQRLTIPMIDAFKTVGDQLSDAENAEARDPEQGVIEDLRRENMRLRRELSEARRDLEAALNTTVQGDVSVRRVRARIIAESSSPSGSVLVANVGSAQGVRSGNLAVANETHLVGRVADVDRTICHVLPITAPGAGRFGATTFAAGGGQGVRFQLEPMGDGRLEGLGYFETDGPEQTPRRARVGEELLLSDDTWPAHEGLIVGTIVEVGTSESGPLRQVIIVEPSIDLRRVESVAIRVPEEGS